MAAVVREINSTSIGTDEDWEGNNASFRCPLCGKTYIVSGLLHRVAPGEGARKCPECGLSEAHVVGGKLGGGRAYIRYEQDQ